ncbi:RHS repeat-associated core domain-containing protein [Flavobacterium sp.]|jgi:RHS repeat-associated protein|uniref:RHS repeat-associated core domain-containing protein n=1 Tax=Flavobacterium sp. TaxID=239 RepID=UPI0022BED14F|nr:RHS repeat-associated core domain-containing protein [Flavobacterium sp.]MCZ8296185.1 RHS repeat-associated core domain-containing protein [Flavobacterium sp.]
MAEQRGQHYYNSPYKFNGKELDEETGLYYYGARYYDPKVSIWLSVDPKAEKYPSYSPYNYCLNNPILFIDPDGQDPIITITNKVVGYAEQKIYRTEGMPNGSDYYIIKVPLYQVNVTDDEDANFKMSFMVTRDAWVLNKTEGNNLVLDNIAFEPAKGGSNEYEGKYIDVYPHNNNTAAFELRQDGSKVLNSEPRKNDKGENVTSASSVMIHVAGIYKNDEENKIRHSSSLACFGIVNKGNSTKNTSDKEANRVINGIWNQADLDSWFGHSDVKIIVQPRENVQRTQTVTPSN